MVVSKKELDKILDKGSKKEVRQIRKLLKGKKFKTRSEATKMIKKLLN